MASRPRPIRTRRAAGQLGAQLTALRERQQLSVEQLAVRASITPGTLRRVENGEAGVGLADFLTVVRALGHLDALSAALEPADRDFFVAGHTDPGPTPKGLPTIGDATSR